MEDKTGNQPRIDPVFYLAVFVVILGAAWSWLPQFPLFKDNPDAKVSYYQNSKLKQNLKEVTIDLHDWDELDRQQKFDLLEYVINFLKTKHRVRITKSPTFYINRINEELITNPEMRQLPIERVVTLLAVMEYDFDNGKDLPEDLALKILGPEVFAINKERKKDYKPRLE